MTDDNNDDISIESLRDEFNHLNVSKSIYKESAQIQMKLIKHNIKKLNKLIELLEPVICEDYYESDKRKSLEMLQSIAQISTNAVNKTSILYFNRYLCKEI